MRGPGKPAERNSVRMIGDGSVPPIRDGTQLFGYTLYNITDFYYCRTCDILHYCTSRIGRGGTRPLIYCAGASRPVSGNRFYGRSSRPVGGRRRGGRGTAADNRSSSDSVEIRKKDCPHYCTVEKTNDGVSPWLFADELRYYRKYRRTCRKQTGGRKK